MNSIESPIVLAPLPLDEADSLFPALGLSDQDALKALRSLIVTPQHHPVEVKQSPVTRSSGSLSGGNDALQDLSDDAGTFSEAHEPAAHFFSPTSAPTDDLVAELKAFIASKSAAPSPPGKSDVELTSESTSPDPALIEALRALLVTPDQVPSAVQSKGMPDEGKDSGSMRVMELFQSLLSEERLPVASLPLLTQVRDALTQTKGDLNHQPEALAQIRALIEALPPEAGAVLVRQQIQTKESPPVAPLDAPSDFTPVLEKSELEILNLGRAILQYLDSQSPASAANFLASVNRPAPHETSSDFTSVLEKSEQEIPNLGQAILQSLDNQSSVSAANVAASVNQPAHLELVDQVSTLMTEMADRVLVTDPLHGQTQEVRIQLAESIMPGTEVRVWREEGGQLRVEFDTTSGYWARVLNEASPLLSQRLNERLNLPDAVLVNVHQQGGQPEDGRSRNRHTPWEVAGQEDPQ